MLSSLAFWCIQFLLVTIVHHTRALVFLILIFVIFILVFHWWFLLTLSIILLLWFLLFILLVKVIHYIFFITIAFFKYTLNHTLSICSLHRLFNSIWVIFVSVTIVLSLLSSTWSPTVSSLVFLVEGLLLYLFLRCGLSKTDGIGLSVWRIINIIVITTVCRFFVLFWFSAFCITFSQFFLFTSLFFSFFLETALVHHTFILKVKAFTLHEWLILFLNLTIPTTAYL